MKGKDIYSVYLQLLDLDETCNAGVLDMALIAAKLHSDGYKASVEQCMDLAERIYGLCISTDEPRFTWYDYADALINWPAVIAVDRLLKLSDDTFETVLIYMATCKRETYSYDVKSSERGAELVATLLSAQSATVRHEPGDNHTTEGRTTNV